MAVAIQRAQMPIADSATASCRWPLALSLFFVVAGCAALAVDVPLARWIHAGGMPGDLKRLLMLSEVFAYGAGVAMILLTVFVLDVEHRRAVARLAVASLGAGLLADGCKLFVGRYRPAHFDLAGGVSDTLVRWFPLFTTVHAERSFLSAHTATAAGLAVGLAWLYPRGRWLFALFAVLAGGQRIVSESHFLSDVCWGAALGLAIAWLAIYYRPFATRFERFERGG